MNINIVGGVYKEFCVEPYWKEIYGSGLRAAYSLKNLTDKIILHTYIGDNLKNQIETFSSSLGIDIEAHRIHNNLSFYYFHGLSTPNVFPNPISISPNDPFKVKEKYIIKFGMFEGNPIVIGEYVVYDPQSTYDPINFKLNNSEAEHLAIIGNSSEIINLGGCPDIKIAGKNLLQSEKAEVVIIKQGAKGATVITKSDIQNISAYETNTVWPIGSGDIFTSIFSVNWFKEPDDPFKAAKLASLATAYYCENNFLPINFDLIYSKRYNEINISGDKKMVYLAGPFFCLSERWLIEETIKYLTQAGIEVFSPLHQNGRGEPKVVAPKDLEGLNKCDIIFAIVDNLDSGTLFEIGYAVSRNKKVIIFNQKEPVEKLKMIIGSGCTVETDYVTAIYKTIWNSLQ
jgi:nucleoside 2-deoxyribosyltransferase